MDHSHTPQRIVVHTVDTQGREALYVTHMPWLDAYKLARHANLYDVTSGDKCSPPMSLKATGHVVSMVVADIDDTVLR